VSDQTASTGIIEDLGDGLVIRHAQMADREPLADLNAVADGPVGHPNEDLRQRTLEMVSSDNPVVGLHYLMLVEDLKTGRLVSSLCLLPHTWSFDGVEFEVGRIESVNTAHEYRNRGLIRKQLNVVHNWSRARGDHVNVIFGMPYFYRQFGYEMALELGGSRKMAIDALEKIDDTGSYIVRNAGEQDLEFITRTYEASRSRYLIANRYGIEQWRDRLFTQRGSRKSAIVETPAGEPVGFLVYDGKVQDHSLSVYMFEADSRVSSSELSRYVLNYLEHEGWRHVSAQEPNSPSSRRTVEWILGTNHLIYGSMGDMLHAGRSQSVSYVRVADLPGFILHIASPLNRRIAESVAAGYSGDINLSFYTGGLTMRFEEGKLVSAAPWGPSIETGWSDEGWNARFPGLTFLQLLFGFRSVDDLLHAFPDASIDSSSTREVLNALFPTKPSSIGFEEEAV
jgi:hypothetical protein